MNIHAQDQSFMCLSSGQTLPPAGDSAVDDSALTVRFLDTTNYLLFRVEGDLDIATVCRARHTLLQVLHVDDTRPVVMDIRGLIYMDSTGLAFLEEVRIGTRYRRFEEEPRCVALMTLPNSHPQRLLELCGFNKIFPIVTSFEELPAPFHR
jgi:anti-anti-sigma factor